MKDCNDFLIVRLSELPELCEAAAEWFSSKWNIPRSAYESSMA